EKVWNQESEDTVPDAIRHVDFPMLGIQRQTDRMKKAAEGPLDDRPRRCIAAVGYVPYSHKAQIRIQPGVLRHRSIGPLQSHAVGEIMVKMVGRGHKDSSRIYLQLPGLVADACLRTGDDGTRGYIAVVRAVEEENLFSVGHRQEICDRIYGKTNHVAEPGFRTFDDAKWRNVSVRVPREYPNTPPRHTPDQNFSMVQIQIHRVGRDE